MSSTNSNIKTILVTGGNKGIGKAICHKLLSDYLDVHIILGSRDIGRGEKTLYELSNSIPNSKHRMQVLQIDVSSDISVVQAAQTVSQQHAQKLYCIVNNAGIIGNSLKETFETNYFGPRRVNDAFIPLLMKPGGKIVNMSSAAGPMFLSNTTPSELTEYLGHPLTIKNGIDQLDDLAKCLCEENVKVNDTFFYYGLSKAFLNAYTVLHAKVDTEFIINSCTPGFIKTDMTKDMGATTDPSKGAECPVYLCMSVNIEKLPSGRYYGSDKQRSPINVYRGPGDPPFEGE